MSAGSPARTPSERPDLEQKRTQARELLRALRNREARAALRFKWTCPRFRGKTPAEIWQESLKLADAQHVVARESGFDSWPALKRYVVALESDPAGPEARFEAAVRCLIHGDREGLADLLAGHPDLATARSARSHHAVLLHYVAANGVENEHQKTPPNAVEMAELLFQAGAAAVVDATADIYGGGSGSTPLVALVTSCHPHHAGVQPDLVRLFRRSGARVNGLYGDGLPLACALAFRPPRRLPVPWRSAARASTTSSSPPPSAARTSCVTSSTRAGPSLTRWQE